MSPFVKEVSTSIVSVFYSTASMRLLSGDMANSHDANKAESAWHATAQSPEPKTQSHSKVSPCDKAPRLERTRIAAEEAEACQTDAAAVFRRMLLQARGRLLQTLSLA